MEWYDFVLVIAIFLAALGFLVLGAYLKKKGKHLPGDDCSGNCATCGKTCTNGKALVDQYHACNCSKCVQEEVK